MLPQLLLPPGQIYQLISEWGLKCIFSSLPAQALSGTGYFTVAHGGDIANVTYCEYLLALRASFVAQGEK